MAKVKSETGCLSASRERMESPKKAGPGGEGPLSLAA